MAPFQLILKLVSIDMRLQDKPSKSIEPFLSNILWLRLLLQIITHCGFQLKSPDLHQPIPWHLLGVYEHLVRSTWVNHWLQIMHPWVLKLGQMLHGNFTSTRVFHQNMIAPVLEKQCWWNITWFSTFSPSGLLHWNWCNHLIIPVPPKEPWSVWNINSLASGRFRFNLR